jgi:hypothetical protein
LFFPPLSWFFPSILCFCFISLFLVPCILRYTTFTFLFPAFVSISTPVVLGIFTFIFALLFPLSALSNTVCYHFLLFLSNLLNPLDLPISFPFPCFVHLFISSRRSLPSASPLSVCSRYLNKRLIVPL